MSLPQASGSNLNTHHRIAKARKQSSQLHFHVSTASNSISDLRLQVCALNSDSAEQQQVLRPSYFRERSLTFNDEIVDRLVDATTGSVMWTIHRPVRGWYLHLRSPNLPRGSAIPLRPSRTAAADIAATPLCFSIGTTIDPVSLSLCTTSLDMPSPLASRSAFESVPLNSSLSSSSSLTGTSEVIELAARTSARPSTLPRHIRRRSAGGSATHAPNVRKPSASSSIYTPASRSTSASTLRLAEEAEEEMEQTERAASSSMNADRPYESSESPFMASQQSSSFGSSNSPSRHSVPAAAAAAVGAPAPRSMLAHSRAASAARSRTCTFVLSDGVASTPAGWAQLNLAPAPGRAVEVQSRLGWARWAWGLLPAQLRPPLSLDTSKNFALRWVDAPCLASSTATATAAQPSVHGMEQGIEVLRFHDSSGWWLGAKTRGSIILQENAVKALRLETAFWISVALAYLEFLEERDGYNAAAGG